MEDNTFDFQTCALHGNGSEDSPQHAIRFPIYAGVAFDFDNAEDMEAAFNFTKPTFVYSRSSNPTVDHFEKKLNLLEKGYGTIAVSSGMAAISNMVLALLAKGDNLIASKHIFGNTYSLFKDTFVNLGIETRFVDFTNINEIENAIDSKTRLLFYETITNPQMIVADCNKIAELASAHDIILAADSTVTTPFLFNAKDYGVDIVIHSTTKYISGGASSVGGAITDLGNYDWQKCPTLKDYHTFGKSAFLYRLRKEVYRNLGSCMTPQSAYLQTLGLETLSLRVEASCRNTLLVAEYLSRQRDVLRVNYPGLAESVWHQISSAQFRDYHGGVLSFELSSKDQAYRFINNLKLIKRATNLNDNKSLIIHPASTIYADRTEEEKHDMGVNDRLIRLSVGIEGTKDLLQDLDQAFHKCR